MVYKIYILIVCFLNRCSKHDRSIFCWINRQHQMPDSPGHLQLWVGPQRCRLFPVLPMYNLWCTYRLLHYIRIFHR